MPYYDRTFRFGLGGGGLTPIVRNLLIANTIIWIAHFFLKPFLFDIFALYPPAVAHDFTVWQLFTYMFLHDRFFHLFFNMFALFMFGCEIERTLGSNKFLKYYIATGVGGGLFQLLINWGTPSVIFGASGAVYGVLVAFGLLFPNRVITVLLFFVLPIQLKAKTLVTIVIGISLLLGFQSELFGTSDGVAHFAHLGGAFTGLLLLRGRFFYQIFLKRIADKQLLKRNEQERQRQERIQQKRKEIDIILDRINDIGYENISKAEKDHLKEASDFLSKEEKIKL